jgi:hypothetical protein
MSEMDLELQRFELPEVSNDLGYPYVVIGFEAAKHAAFDHQVDAIWMVDDDPFAPGLICIFYLENARWYRRF